MSEKTDTISIPIGGSIENRSSKHIAELPPEELPEEIRKMLSARTNAPKERSVLDMLEGKHVLSTILYLDEVAPVMKCDIYKEISRSAGMKDKVQDLYDMGLVQIYATGRTNAGVVVMTPKGKEVAKTIRDILDLIEKE